MSARLLARGVCVTPRRAGDDDWCVVTLRGAADRAAVAAIVGGAGQEAAAAWARGLPPRDAAAALQDAGVPSGMLVRVADLPERQREAVVLKYVGDLDHRAVAAALGTTPAMSRRLVSDALAALRVDLEDLR